MPKKEQERPIAVEQYRLLRDLPYYVELGMQAISGWLHAGDIVIVHDVLDKDGNFWIRHDAGWTLARRMESVYAEPIEIKIEEQ